MPHNIEKIVGDQGWHPPDDIESKHSKCHWIWWLDELVNTKLKLKCGFLHLLVGSYDKQVPL